MLKKSLFIAVSILLLLVSSAFGAMDAKKAEALVDDYLQTLSSLKPHLTNFEDTSLTMEQMDAALHQANVTDNFLKSAFMADEFYKSPAISVNKLPKVEYLVIDNVTEHTEQKIGGSRLEGDYCLVTVLIVNNEDKWKVKNTYKVVMYRLSRNWTFRPLDLRVSQIPLNT